MTFQTLNGSDGTQIAYHHYVGENKGLTPILFCGGYMSDMEGSKATWLEKECRKDGRGYIRFDYLGHGQSSGKFTDGTIGKWAQNAIDMLDQLATEKHIVIGSSMGGWIMLLTALARPDKVSAIIGIAAAPDFTEKMYHYELNDQQRQEIQDNGITYLPSEYENPYEVTRDLIEDGRENLLLTGSIDIQCPIRLFHGKADTVVPWQVAEEIKEKVNSNDVTCHYVDDGGHGMSRPEDLKILKSLIEGLD